MASVIDKIDIYLRKLSASEREKFLEGLFSKYVSRDYLSNYSSFNYYGFAISSASLRTIAFQYVLLHPESKEIKEQYRLAKIEEAIVHSKIDVPKFHRQFERFIAGEKLTLLEKAQADKYAKQYASEEELTIYQNQKNKYKRKSQLEKSTIPCNQFYQGTDSAVTSVIDRIDIYLGKLSASEREKFLEGLFSKYVSREYLSNYLSFDYYGFAISSSSLRTIAFQYVLLHPESKELKEQYRLAKIEEAIVHSKIDVPEFRHQFERFMAGEKLTLSEKAQADKYAKQYASDEEKKNYQVVKEESKKNSKKRESRASIAYKKYCECGYSDDFFKLSSKLNISKAELAVLPLQYINNELSGEEQQKAFQTNLHTMRIFIEKMQQVEHDQKIQEAKTLVEGALAIDAYDVSSLCKQLSISRKELERTISFLASDDCLETQDLVSQVAKKYSMDNILLSSAIKKVAGLTKQDSDNKSLDYCYRLLEYALYIGCYKDCPPRAVLYQATKILSEEELLPFRKLIRAYINYSQLNDTYSSDMVFQEKRFHRENDGTLKDSTYQLNPEQKQSILDFFNRHAIPFDYVIYSVARKRLIDGSFDPNGDLVLNGKVFPSDEKFVQKKID